MNHLLQHVDWHVVYIFVQGVWSIFWSFAPTPKPNTWYNAIFQTAQWLALNPGRAMAVARNGAPPPVPPTKGVTP